MTETITIVPHHVKAYFEVFFFGKDPKDRFSWYQNKKFGKEAKSLIIKVVSNPVQAVQIINTFDSFCEMCPKYRHGKNFTGKSECFDYYIHRRKKLNPGELIKANDFGVFRLLNESPILSRDLFECTKQFYFDLLRGIEIPYYLAIDKEDINFAMQKFQDEGYDESNLVSKIFSTNEQRYSLKERNLFGKLGHQLRQHFIAP